MTDNTAKCASTQDARVGMERRAAVRDALKTLSEYRDIPHTVALLLMSVEKQARWSGDRPVAGRFFATFSIGDVR